MALTIAVVLAFGTLFAAPASANSAESGPVTIVGDPIIGQTLTVDEGTWDEGTTFAYEWRYGSGNPIEGATSDSFAPTEAQRFYYIYVAVTGTLSGTSEMVASASVRVLRPLMATGTVSVSGSAVVGSVLTATAGNDWPEGATLSYSWEWSNGEWGDGIEGATGTTFVVPAAQVGRQIVGVIEASLDGFEPARAYASTAFVTAAPTPVAPVTTPVTPVTAAPTPVTPASSTPASTAAAPVATSAELAAFLTAARVETRTAASAGLPATGLDVTKPYTATVDWAAADGFVDVYAYSTPTLVGTFPVVNGKVQVVLSSAMLALLASGSHTLVFTGQSSGAVSAVAFSIAAVAAAPALAATGVDPIVPLGSAALLFLLGAALVVVRRRLTLA